MITYGEMPHESFDEFEPNLPGIYHGLPLQTTTRMPKVKGQGRTRLKLGFEAWRRHHFRLVLIDWFLQFYHDPSLFCTLRSLL